MKVQLKPHDIANDVRLRRTQHSGSFLLVEGADDGRLYERFIDRSRCQLIVAHCKENVEGAICQLDSTNVAGVVGIVDCDFDVLSGRDLPNQNVVRGDCHDLEAECVRSPAFEAVRIEYTSSDKLSKFETRHGKSLKNCLLEAAAYVGCLRWHSLKQGLNLEFEGVQFSRFVDRHTLILDLGLLVRELKNNSQNPALPDQELIAAVTPETRSQDPWHICCGPDIVELLTLALRSAVGSQQNLTSDEVTRSLRLAYSDQHFFESGLCARIMDWEVRTGFKVLK